MLSYCWLILIPLLAFIPPACGGSPPRGQDGGGGAGGSSPRPADIDLEALAAGEVVRGFRTEAIYVNDRDQAMGARFVDERTGFTLDFIQIESVPQAFIWVNTLPDSDRGEPHTQEHLLLGKGNVGRYVASLESMSLADSSAFTQHIRTAYHLHSNAGLRAFLDVLEHRLDSLLHPDYTDEEVRREVHNFTVTVDSGDGGLRLEEGGTVYNEMVSAWERANYRLWMAFTRTLYGAGHPMALSSGGLPEAIREATPEHIRHFHADHHWLGNMGMIGAFSASVPLADLLESIGAMLQRLEPEPVVPGTSIVTLETLPAPEPAPSTSVQFVDYPNEEGQDTVTIEFAWPPVLDLEPDEELLLDLFLWNLASDPNSNLYVRFIDSERREISIDATEVYAGFIDWPGLPVYVGLMGVPSGQVDEDVVEDLRRRVRAELETIAGWAAGSDELIDFNRRLRSRLVASQRSTRDFVDSPPGFGIRGTGAEWIEHLAFLSRGDEFRRSLTRRPQQSTIEALLDSQENIWTDRLSRWGLLEVEPYAFATRPSPEVHEQLQGEREARLETELERLMADYGTTDPQEAIQQFQRQYDTESVALEAVAAQVPVPPLVDDLPMTQDDTLTLEVGEIEGIPLVTSVFETTTGATVGLALSLDRATPEDLVYLALLPSLVRRVGIADGDEVIPYREMVERLQNEILALGVGISADFVTDRVEIELSASGTTPDEARTALAWLRRVLYHADFRPENLPRIRDVVDEALDALRRTTQRSEEAWVYDPALAYRRQDNPLLLATRSFLTRTHHVQRLRWLLAGADGDTLAEVEAFLTGLREAGDGRDRAGLTELLDSASFDDLSEGARTIAEHAVEDLRLTLGDIPDDALAGDWAYLTRQIAHDLATPPEQVLAHLDDLRRRLLRRSGARLWAVGAPSTLESLAPDIEGLVAGLDPEADPPRHTWGDHQLVDERLEARLEQPVDPVFVGLVNPDTHGGVFLHSVPTASYLEFERESLLDFLSGRMYGGGGAHSLFMKTWGAGLAYSNGVRADPHRGTLRYYAERCPELPQTMRFVIQQLEAVTEDPQLGEYALAQVFESRSSRRYETRAAAMARDLADGRTPERVRAFREAVLELRRQADLSAQLFARMEEVYGRILPGYGGPSSQVEGGVFFVIGPAAQLDTYESYLRGVEGEEARVYRIYPRDFWQTGPRSND